MSVEDAQAADAPRIHDEREGNVLVRGNVARGDLDAALAAAEVEVEGVFETGFIEHAYIEPEAGYAERVGDRVEVQVTTQSPHLDRTELEAILGLPDGGVRIKPTAVGGGFGSKLDLSVQPYLALAAWKLDRPVRLTYTRPESMMSTTKRHPSRMRVRIGATRDGRLTAMDFERRVRHRGVRVVGTDRREPRAGARERAVRLRRLPRADRRRPHERAAVGRVPRVRRAAVDDRDRGAARRARRRCRRSTGSSSATRNALTAGVPTVTGQVFASGVGYRECLEALRPHRDRALAEAAAANAVGGTDPPRRRPRRHVVRVRQHGAAEPLDDQGRAPRDGRVALYQGAVDMGQGANTVMTQICADALGVDMARIETLGADTDATPDAGKSSASRQTFVSGNATFLAATALRERLLAAGRGLRRRAPRARRPPPRRARPRRDDGRWTSRALDTDDDGLVASSSATYDPPTTALDEDGQGEPYAQFGYGAHLAELEVDLELGTVQLRRITAAHDVGRAVNPTLVEGQIEGGVAQGIGMALMEEYVPGRNENLHDYLIPTIGDVPEVVSILVESGDPVGPYGAKGIGEHALVPTAPAILNAIRDAVGAGVRRLPATPDRVLAGDRGRAARR